MNAPLQVLIKVLINTPVQVRKQVKHVIIMLDSSPCPNLVLPMLHLVYHNIPCGLLLW